MNTSNRLIGRFGVDVGVGNFLGDVRIRLLEAIGQCGSISQAARQVPLSYKAAWDAVDAMNNLAAQPLVDRAVGGRHGGGTVLTDYGRRVIMLYRAMETEYQAALDRVAARLDMPVGEADDHGALRNVVRSMQLTASARNQFVGPVTSLRAGEVTFEVGIRFDGQNEITGHISRESAERMHLAIGQTLHAWVNDSAVVLATEGGLRISARNQLWGEVLRVHPGPVAVDVVLALPGGRTVGSIITLDALNELGLREGSRACAVFKASSVMFSAFE